MVVVVKVNSAFPNLPFCDFGPRTSDSCLSIVKKFSLRGKNVQIRTMGDIRCCTAHPFVGEMMHGGVMVDWWSQ